MNVDAGQDFPFQAEAHAEPDLSGIKVFQVYGELALEVVFGVFADGPNGRGLFGYAKQCP